MAFTASAVWEVQTGGSDSNAGGFDPGVAGFPTDGTTDANTGNTSAPVFSSASYNFVPGDVGHWIYIKSGTNSIPGWYKITSVASNKATLNATIGAAVLAAGTPTTAAGIATVGTPTSLTWGIDYSQSAPARIAFTDMVIGGTTTQFTSAGNPVGKNFVGNIINVTGGTGFTVQRVAVVSTSGTTATCDKSLGTGASTGGTGNLGGAFASPALPFTLTATAHMVFIQTGAYSITSASTNVTGGCLSIGANVLVMGYGTVRGDMGTAPALTASGITSATLVTTTNVVDPFLINLTVDGAGLSSLRGFLMGRGPGYLLTAKNCTNGGFVTNATSPNLIKCTATGCSSQPAFSVSYAIDCVAYANTVTGFQSIAAISVFTNCVAYGNSGASSDGFSLSNAPCIVNNCTAYNNGRDGLRVSSSAGDTSVINCVAESNTGTGFNFLATNNHIINCAAYLNGTNYAIAGRFAQTLACITGTASFFVNAGSGNFALNANAGGGASLRAAGIPGVTPDGLSTGYADIGAIQSMNRALLETGMLGGLAA